MEESSGKMSPDRYSAPIAVLKSDAEAEAGEQHKCPYCRWGFHTLYRLDTWPESHAGCAHCVIEFLRTDDYLIYQEGGATGHVTPQDVPG
jgi:ribosomal protein L37AE/L43A